MISIPFSKYCLEEIHLNSGKNIKCICLFIKWYWKQWSKTKLKIVGKVFESHSTLLKKIDKTETDKAIA